MGMNILKGKLSYTLAVLAIIGATAGYFGHLIDLQTALNMIWAGAAVFGIRRAIGS